jgi:hypothetical protein
MKLAATISVLAHAKDSNSVNRKVRSHGLPITIEAPKYTNRTLHDENAKLVYSRFMHHDYGYISKTTGRDGDEVDVFVGPMKNAAEVYVVHMIDKGPDKSAREDEDKCFVGFQSADAARAAFLAHYPKDFYGGMTALPLAVFKQKLKTANLPYRRKKITAVLGE